MTFGQQNTEAEPQMDYALEKELIFWYSRDVFCSCTWGNHRKKILGTWFKKTEEEKRLFYKIADLTKPPTW
jgi:hypothetical protein